MSCIQRVLEEKKEVTVPWWFRTMLRDAIGPKTGLYGRWHNLESTNYNLTVCAIEKVASTTMRSLFCDLDAEVFRGPSCRKAPDPIPDHDRKIVFFRDPLERFLSGYIDKCIHRRREKHCEPNEVFNNDANGYTRGLTDHKKELFAAYVDTVPLKWNLHFFPQSLYCDGIYRHLHEYDFTGKMGPNFYRDLRQFGNRYGKNVSAIVNRIFKVPLNETINTGTGTQAPKFVKVYYTPRSLKRVLEYVSIDYLLLNLDIPDWANKMLLQDDRSY